MIEGLRFASAIKATSQHSRTCIGKEAGIKCEDDRDSHRHLFPPFYGRMQMQMHWCHPPIPVRFRRFAIHPLGDQPRGECGLPEIILNPLPQHASVVFTLLSPLLLVLPTSLAPLPLTMMGACLLALVFGIASAYAKGKAGDISVATGGNNWDVPWYIKATFAFYIIWAIVSFAQFVLILTQLKPVPPTITIFSFSSLYQPISPNSPYQPNSSPHTGRIRPRLPYILLAIITAFLTLGYIFWAALQKTENGTTVPEQVLYNLVDVANFFLYFNLPGHAAVLLWLTHQRAQVFHSQSQLQSSPPIKLPKPFILSLWKRCLDWSLVVITYALGLTWMAIYASWNNLWLKGNMEEAAYYNYRDAANGFFHALSGMTVILAVDVLVTLIVLYAMERKSRYQDLIISRLLFISAPFLFLFALEWLAVDVYQFTTAAKNPNINWNYIYLFQSIFEGICPVVITIGCLLTMRLYQLPLAPSQQYNQGMAQYGHQPGWYGAGTGAGVGMGSQAEVPRDSSPQSSGLPPSISPYYPPSYYTGGYTSPPVPTPSPSMGIHERIEKVQPFRIPGGD